MSVEPSTPDPGIEPAPAEPEAPETLTMEQRTAILEREVMNGVKAGYSVESQGQTQAVLVKNRRTMHLLHLGLTIVTLGAWLIVWIVLVLARRKKKRIMLGVSPTGEIVRKAA
jgi:hypothetical protein